MRNLAIAMILFTASPLFAQDPKKDLEKLNGVWTVTSATAGGKKIPDDVVKDVKLTFADGTFSARSGADEIKGTFKIDATKKPMTMDISPETGPNKCQTQLAIYDLQTGVLKICAGDYDQKDRPLDFETKNKPGVKLLTFKKGP